MLVCFCVHSLPWVVNGPNSLSHILTITLYVIIFFLVMAMHLIKIQIKMKLYFSWKSTAVLKLVHLRPYGKLGANQKFLLNITWSRTVTDKR